MLPSTMHAVYLTGHGGFDQLEYRTDVPVPSPGRDEVLIQVAAAGINNTDINTRVGWYSKAVVEDTGSGGEGGFAASDSDDASWSGAPLEFPRIQGADVCGHVVACGEGVAATRVGERVIVRNMLRTYVGYEPFQCWTIGSECDGGFAQFVVAPSAETHAVVSTLSDAELAAIPCAYSTAENMLHRAGLGAERVLITGASGGVGSAAVQLAKCRGATVWALSSEAKAGAVKALGADHVLDRNVNLVEAVGAESIDVVVDVVGGAGWSTLLELLRRGGRYAVAGAIAGPVAEIDLRSVYLKDLTLFGCTWQEDVVFENLLEHLRADRLQPAVAGTYPLKDIVTAQQVFLSKVGAGNLVLIPPPVSAP